MLNFLPSLKNAKNSERLDPEALADEEASVAVLEAKEAGRLAQLLRREDETLRKLEACREELKALSRSKAGGLAAKVLGRHDVPLTPAVAPVPEREKALVARRAAVDARLAAIDAERRRAARREEALAAAETAIVELQKGAQEVRERARAVEEAERAAKAAAPAPAPRAAPKPDERRRAPRVAMTADVTLSSDSNFYSGFSSDLSDGGLFVATCDLLERGTEVDLTFSLPAGPKVSARGVVRWTREYNDATPDVFPGVGIEFVSMDEEQRKAVHAFVAQREPLFWSS